MGSSPSRASPSAIERSLRTSEAGSGSHGHQGRYTKSASKRRPASRIQTLRQHRPPLPHFHRIGMPPHPALLSRSSTPRTMALWSERRLPTRGDRPESRCARVYPHESRSRRPPGTATPHRSLGAPSVPAPARFRYPFCATFATRLGQRWVGASTIRTFTPASGRTTSRSRLPMHPAPPHSPHTPAPGHPPRHRHHRLGEGWQERRRHRLADLDQQHLDLQCLANPVAVPGRQTIIRPVQPDRHLRVGRPIGPLRPETTTPSGPSQVWHQ